MADDNSKDEKRINFAAIFPPVYGVSPTNQDSGLTEDEKRRTNEFLDEFIKLQLKYDVRYFNDRETGEPVVYALREDDDPNERTFEYLRKELDDAYEK